MRILICTIILFVVTNVSAQQPLTEAQKISHLITFVRNLKGAIFIRNGSEHPPTAAADHLQMKWDKAGSRISNARDFIEKIATKSSMSGELYRIRFANGKEFPCHMVLLNELKKLEEGKAAQH